MPASTAITATDLNQPMIDHAAAIGAARPVTWQQADAIDLPFDDVCFDAVVCQFGVMFFPDRHKAFTGDAPRALPWRISGVQRVGSTGAEPVRNHGHRRAGEPCSPTTHLGSSRASPHGYHDTERIRADLVAAGFNSLLTIDTVPARSLAALVQRPGHRFRQGTPLRNEILTRDPDGLADATSVAAQLIAERFGESNIDGAMSAHVVTARKM